MNRTNMYLGNVMQWRRKYGCAGCMQDFRSSHVTIADVTKYIVRLDGCICILEKQKSFVKTKHIFVELYSRALT